MTTNSQPLFSKEEFEQMFVAQPAQWLVWESKCTNFVLWHGHYLGNPDDDPKLWRARVNELRNLLGEESDKFPEYPDWLERALNFEMTFQSKKAFVNWLCSVLDPKKYYYDVSSFNRPFNSYSYAFEHRLVLHRSQEKWNFQFQIEQEPPEGPVKELLKTAPAYHYEDWNMALSPNYPTRQKALDEFYLAFHKDKAMWDFLRQK